MTKVIVDYKDFLRMNECIAFASSVINSIDIADIDWVESCVLPKPWKDWLIDVVTKAWNVSREIQSNHP